jgi:hypothetical protein
MNRMEFEPTIPVLGQAKIVHALDGAATVVGILRFGKCFSRDESDGTGIMQSV